MRKKVTGLFTVALVLFLVAGVNANIVTNYYDDFSGSLADPLNGTAPDVRLGTEAWNSSANYKADGSFNVSVANGTAYLPLVIETGKVYTVSLVVTVTAAGNVQNWGGLGFVDSSATTAVSPLTTGSAATMILRKNGTIVGYRNGSLSVGNGTGYGSTQTLSMVLTTHADATPWKVDYFVGNDPMLTYTYASIPTITRIAIGTGGTSAIAGSFDNLAVTASETVMPDPAVLTIGSSEGIVTISVSNLLSSAINTLQSKTNLNVAGWSDVSSVSAVTETNWVVSATNLNTFYRIESSY